MNFKLTAQMRKREDLNEGKLLLVHPTEIAPKLEVLKETCMYVLTTQIKIFTSSSPHKKSIKTTVLPRTS